VASREFHYLLAQFAMKDKQWDVAMRAWKEGDILAGIYEPEEIGWDPNDWNKPVKEIWAVQVINNTYNAGETHESTKKIEIDE
jgi:nitrogen fixation protein FixH